MISEIHTHEDPILTREEAIEILNTPDDQLDMLIEPLLSASQRMDLPEQR